MKLKLRLQSSTVPNDVLLVYSILHSFSSFISASSGIKLLKKIYIGNWVTHTTGTSKCIDMKNSQQK